MITKTYIIEGSRDGENWLSVNFELDEVSAVKSMECYTREYPELKIRFRESSMGVDQ